MESRRCWQNRSSWKENFCLNAICAFATNGKFSTWLRAWLQTPTRPSSKGEGMKIYPPLTRDEVSVSLFASKCLIKLFHQLIRGNFSSIKAVRSVAPRLEPVCYKCQNHTVPQNGNRQTTEPSRQLPKRRKFGCLGRSCLPSSLLLTSSATHSSVTNLGAIKMSATKQNNTKTSWKELSDLALDWYCVLCLVQRSKLAGFNGSYA